MNITEVLAYPVWVGRRNQCLIKVETDEGLVGWGEAGLSGRELAVQAMVRHFREFLVGKDPLRRGALWQEMYRSQYFEGGRTITAAISAIDIALHDIAGKAAGLPVYQLLGGAQRDRVPCFTSVRGNTAELAAKRITDLMRLGWDSFRLPTINSTSPSDEGLFEPRESIALTAALARQIRETVGPVPTLGIDYHHRLSVAEAASFCHRLDPAILDFLEEPIRDETPEAYETLRSMTGMPFAIGEEMSSKWQIAPYLERGLTNFCRLDICNIGGFTEAMKVAGWAETHYIDLMPHNPLGPICTAASIHLAVAVPNFAWLEVALTDANTLGHVDDELFPVRPALDGATFPLPGAPGLGVEINEDAVKRQSFRFWEAPRYHRRDGSLTNW